MHVKNIWPTSALNGKSSHNLFEDETPTLNHCRVLGSIIYILIYEEKRKKAYNKGAKFAPRAQCGILVGYDGKAIYQIYLEKDAAVIKVKDLQIHENTTAKESSELPIYDVISADKQGSNIATQSAIPSTSIAPIILIAEGPKQNQGRPKKVTTDFNDFSSELSDALLSSKKHTPKRKRGRPRKNPLSEDNPQQPSQTQIHALITQLHLALTKQDWEAAVNSLNADDNHSLDPLILLTKQLEEVQAYDP